MVSLGCKKLILIEYIFEINTANEFFKYFSFSQVSFYMNLGLMGLNFNLHLANASKVVIYSHTVNNIPRTMFAPVVYSGVSVLDNRRNCAFYNQSSYLLQSANILSLSLKLLSIIADNPYQTTCSNPKKICTITSDKNYGLTVVISK